MNDSLFTQLGRRWAMRFSKPAGAPLRPGAVVKIVGRVVPDEEPRVSPLGGRESVVYTVKGNRVEGTGRNRRVIIIADEEWSRPFWIERDGDRVLVDPEGWLELLASSVRIPSSPRTLANLDAFAARYGNHEREFFEGFGGGASYFERCVEVGAQIAVIGEVYEHAIAADGYRDQRTVYALRPPARGRLWISTSLAHASS